MLELLQRLFGREHHETPSKKTAKDRLRLVLVHDRANVSPQLLEALKEDLIGVISRYMEIDQENLDVSFTSEDDTVALVANIPILSVKRGFSPEAKAQ